jgi:hypothetical protein
MVAGVVGVGNGWCVLWFIIEEKQNIQVWTKHTKISY